MTPLPAPLRSPLEPRVLQGGVAGAAALLLLAASSQVRAASENGAADHAVPAAASSGVGGAGPGSSPSPGAGGLGSTTPGWKLGAGQAPVVGGNAVSARERALGEAFKQAVDQALNTILEPARRAAEGRTVNLVLSRPRLYVTRYRTLEEGEVGPLYRVRLEAEIDENALERAFVHAPAAAAGSAVGASGFWVASTGDPEDAALLVSALRKQGLRAEAAPATGAALANATNLPESASKAKMLAAVMVTGTASDEAVIRGVGVWSSGCRLQGKVLAAPSGELLNDLDATDHGFGANLALARKACLAAASDALVGQLAPLGEGLATANGARPLVLEVTTTAPAALPQLVKVLRAMAAISGAEIRHIGGGKADLWVRTTLPPQGLLAALERDRQTGLQIIPVGGGDTADRLRIALQLVEPSASPPASDASAATVTPASSPGAAAPGAHAGPGGVTP